MKINNDRSLLKRIITWQNCKEAMILGKNHVSMDVFRSSYQKGVLRDTPLEVLHKGDGVLLTATFSRFLSDLWTSRRIRSLRSPTSPWSDGVFSVNFLRRKMGRTRHWGWEEKCQQRMHPWMFFPCFFDLTYNIGSFLWWMAGGWLWFTKWVQLDSSMNFAPGWS